VGHRFVSKQQIPASAPEHEPEVRPAATVVVLRDADGLEVLLVRRASTLAFYGGAWVFPGGRIDPEDGDLEHALPAAAARAGARELREEAGLIVQETELVYFARWVTPPGRTRRFDTFYFAALAPDGEVQVDLGEVDDYRWMTPHAALEAHERKEIELPPPTFVTLVTLVALSAGRNALECHSVLGTETTLYVPHPCATEAGTVYLYPGDAGYETRDVNAVGPRHRLVAHGSSWSYERHV
jgi:8-oxo-dGTP pyrophosphatase MutT (NUDIX family)